MSAATFAPPTIAAPPSTSQPEVSALLASLSSSLTEPGHPPSTDDLTVVPPVPENLEEAGVPASMVEQLILKHLYFRGELTGRELAGALGLIFSVIDGLLETFKRQHLIGVKRSSGMGNNSAIFTLTEAGRSLTREYMEQNQYVGPCPVPLYQYTSVVRQQRLAENWLTPDALRSAFHNIVVNDDILSQIGPAVNSNRSFLLYGQPGNGKTSLAECLFRIQTSPIFMPFAIEYQGNIVQIYDPIYHQPIADPEPSVLTIAEQTYDRRWFRTRRPFIVTGGELSLEMLDLSYNPVSKVYDAPFQLKANNGIYLIDDFGRQKASPAEVLNRWIVPMERHIDYLTFRTGGKMTVPFECFLIFSTNLRPENLGDEAFLRRIQYKMYLRNPQAAEFKQIFERFCEARQIASPDGLVSRFIEKHYSSTGRALRRCHPRDVISHAIDIIHFEKRKPELCEDLLDRAIASCFVEDPGEE